MYAMLNINVYLITLKMKANNTTCKKEEHNKNLIIYHVTQHCFQIQTYSNCRLVSKQLHYYQEIKINKIFHLLDTISLMLIIQQYNKLIYFF